MGFRTSASVAASTPARIALVLLLAVLAPSKAGAGSLCALTPDDLALQCSRIVTGRVVALRPNPLGQTPVTDVTIQVSDVLKGAPVSQTTFSTLGGWMGSEFVVVDGEARFRVGEEAVVFLEDSPASGRTWVMGGYQGKYGVERGRLQITGLSLDTFEARIRARVEGGQARITAAAARTELVGPHVLGVSPSTVGSAGDDVLEITIRGQDFGDSPGRVMFPDWFTRVPGATLAWSDTLITVHPPVPDTMLLVELTSGPVEVVDALGRSSLPLDDCSVPSCQAASYLHVYYNYPRFRWADPHPAAVYHVNPADLPRPCATDAIDAAFETWNRVAGSRFRFVRGDTTSNRPDVHDHVNTIGCLSPWPYSKAWIAASIPWAHYERDSVVLDEVDTGFNTDNWHFSCDSANVYGIDVQTAMLHEAGHWLRLRHVNQDDEIMQVSGLVNRILRSLAPGDRAGISHIYPSYGHLEVLRDQVQLCPAGDADSVVLGMTVLDREGLPRAGVPPESVAVVLTGVPGGPVRAIASGPTALDGYARIVMRSAVGANFSPSLEADAAGHLLDGPPTATFFPMDLSGDGRVGPEDLTLARRIGQLPGRSAYGPDADEILLHMGHQLPGLPPENRPAMASLSVSPSPFHGSTYVSFSSPAAGPVQLAAYSVEGRRVWTWQTLLPAPGNGVATWDGAGEDGRDLPAGLYLIRARLAGRQIVRKVLRLH